MLLLRYIVLLARQLSAKLVFATPPAIALTVNVADKFVFFVAIVDPRLCLDMRKRDIVGNRCTFDMIYRFADAEEFLRVMRVFGGRFHLDGFPYAGNRVCFRATQEREAIASEKLNFVTICQR